MTKNKKSIVYVAMSGGVDSSVAAALLSAENGPASGGKKYNVVGVFFKPWSPLIRQGYTGRAICNWQEDRQMAMRVAAKLGIKFKTWDFSKEYGDKVVRYMIDGYRHGETPNPDVMCNKEIKFGLFLKKALAEGADYVATGHYVRLRRPAIKQASHKAVRLFKGVDKNKDQSYFLWTLDQKQLKYCLFPIGEYEKPEVRKLAKKFGLPNHDKKDSQGICFVGKMDVKDFLKSQIKPKQGRIILRSTDKIIGEHDGAYYYTIGQRRGLNIGISGGPYFVVNKDLKKNIIYVEKEKLFNTNFTVNNVNWLGDPKLPLASQVKIRYRNNSTTAIVKQNGSINSVVVKLSKPASSVTPGQSAVFYRGQEMLGGGIIT